MELGLSSPGARALWGMGLSLPGGLPPGSMPRGCFLVDSSPGSGVGVGIPGLLHHPQGCLGQDGPEPAGDVHAHVVHLVSVLPRATRSIRVRSVLQNLHTTAFATRLVPALLLWGQRPLHCEVATVVYRRGLGRPGLGPLKGGGALANQTGSSSVTPGPPNSDPGSECPCTPTGG